MFEPRGVLDQRAQVGVERLLLLLIGLHAQAQFALLVLQLLDRVVQLALQLGIVSAELPELGAKLVNGGREVDHRMSAAVDLQAQRLDLLHSRVECVEHVQPALDRHQHLGLDRRRRRLRQPPKLLALEARAADGLDRLWTARPARDRRGLLVQTCPY